MADHRRDARPAIALVLLRDGHPQRLAEIFLRQAEQPAILHPPSVEALDEARAYLAHPVLGSRLRECAAALTGLDGTDPVAVFGPVDAQKLRSSMTLFAAAAPDELVFSRVLDRFCAGRPDPATTRLLDEGAPPAPG